MDKTEISKMLGLLIATIVCSTGINMYIDSDTPLYSCESKSIISDCVNGVKADGVRCYHDPDNGRKYMHCSEGWQEHFITSEQQPQNQPDTQQKSITVLPSDVREGSYYCHVNGECTNEIK